MCLVVIVLFLLAIGFLVFKNRYKKGSQGSLHGGGGDEEEGLMKSTIDTAINEPGNILNFVLESSQTGAFESTHEERIQDPGFSEEGRGTLSRNNK